MSDKKWWAVFGDGELLGVTDDLGKAEEVLLKQYAEDNPGDDMSSIVLDLKGGDWCLMKIPFRYRMWEYKAMTTEAL